MMLTGAPTRSGSGGYVKMSKISIPALVFLLLMTGCAGIATGMDVTDRRSHVTIFSDEGEKKEIWLDRLDTPVIQAPTIPSGSFKKSDGVYWYPGSVSLEGLARFSISEGDTWLLRFSAEPLKDKRYSVFSYTLSHAGEVKRTGEVTFPGPIDILSGIERPLVTLIDIETKNGDWFSVGVTIGNR